MSTTIRDIAERAEVSQATVSLVLNNKRGVSQGTRERILEIARELDYGIPKGGRGARNRLGTVKFLKIAMHGHTVNRDHNVFISDYIDGLTRGATQYGYSMEINSFAGSEAEAIAQTVEKDNSLAGVVVLGTELTPEDVQTIGSVAKPVLFLDTYYDFLPYDFVDMNNTDAVYLVVSHLVDNGHQDIGFVRSAVNTHNFDLRHEGFWQAVRELGIVIKNRNIFTVDSTYHGAYRDMLKVLSSKPELPTALFVTNDIMAYGTIRALQTMGYTVPEDISVVGFDDLPSSSFMLPPLTTIEVSKQLMGEMAIRLLSIRMGSPESVPPMKVQVGANLIVRDSVKTLPVTFSQ